SRYISLRSRYPFSRAFAREKGTKSLRDGAGGLPDDHIESVPDVDEPDLDDERGERLLVVMALGLVPDFVGDGVGAVGDPRGGLGQRERGPFAFREIGRVAPGGHGVDPLVRIARALQLARMHVDAKAAAVDL